MRILTLILYTRLHSYLTDNFIWTPIPTLPTTSFDSCFRTIVPGRGSYRTYSHIHMKSTSSPVGKKLSNCLWWVTFPQNVIFCSKTTWIGSLTTLFILFFQEFQISESLHNFRCNLHQNTWRAHGLMTHVPVKPCIEENDILQPSPNCCKFSLRSRQNSNIFLGLEVGIWLIGKCSQF